MADIEFFEDDYGYAAQDRAAAAHAPAEGPGRISALVNWAGALVSLGLVVGMGIWAWQLTMRDVSGVPVVRALDGPMRVPPEDPGGTQAPHQGLAVNRIAEGEEAAPVPDRLVLAPPPVDLDDVSYGAPVAVSPEAPAAPAAPVDEPATETAVTGVADVPEEEAAPSGAVALADRLIGNRLIDERGSSAVTASAITEAVAAALPEAVAAGEAAVDGDSVGVTRIQTIPISVPGVRRSPRPSQRPAGLAPAVAAEPAVAEAAAPDGTGGDGVLEVASADLPDGARLVQLGAFDTPDLAREEWARLSRLFPDFLTGRARVIEQASSGGQDFYRLRATGFDDLAASRRFCAALVAQGAACIPVTVR